MEIEHKENEFGNPIHYNNTYLAESIWKSSEPASVRHLATLTLSALCTVPNVVLVFIVCKNRHHRSDWYLIILNWSIANILQIMALIHFLLLQRLYQTDDEFVDIFYCINWILALVPTMFATLYTFEHLMNTSQFCFYSTIYIWVVSVIGIFLVVYSINVFFTQIVVLMTFGLLKFLCVLNVIVRFNLYLLLDKDDRLTLSRLIMASICVVSNFVFWFFELLSLVVSVPPLLLDILLAIVHVNGFANLVILFRYDPHFLSPHTTENLQRNDFT